MTVLEDPFLKRTFLLCFSTLAVVSLVLFIWASLAATGISATLFPGSADAQENTLQLGRNVRNSFHDATRTAAHLADSVVGIVTLQAVIRPADSIATPVITLAPLTLASRTTPPSPTPLPMARSRLPCRSRPSAPNFATAAVL